MKKPLILLGALLALLSLAQAGEPKHLFILSGQSNMVGIKENQSFVPAVKKAFGAENIIVVKDAMGGRPIRNWYKQWKPAGTDVVPEGNGHLYDRLMTKVMKAIKGQELATVTFVWMQGERDAKEMHGEVYAESLRGLIGQVKSDLKLEKLNFVIGRLSDFDMANKQYKHWTMVREVQVKVAEADPLGVWVDTDDWNGPNNELHYDAPGYQQLGEAFAREAIALIRGK